MKTPTIKQIVDTLKCAYNITDVRQFNTDLINAIGECKRAQMSLADNRDQIAGEKRALTVWNNLLADELNKLYNAQTEDEIECITNDICSYAISRSKSKQNLKFYHDTANTVVTNSHAAYKVLLKYYQVALDIIENKKAEAQKAEEALKAAKEAEAHSNLYTLTRKEAVDLLSHITKALTSNKDEQTFYLDMSHYKK